MKKYAKLQLGITMLTTALIIVNIVLQVILYRQSKAREIPETPSHSKYIYNPPIKTDYVDKTMHKLDSLRIDAMVKIYEQRVQVLRKENELRKAAYGQPVVYEIPKNGANKYLDSLTKEGKIDESTRRKIQNILINQMK